MNKIEVYRKSALPLKPDVSGAQMWAVGLKKTMLTYFELEPNTKFPEHSHEAEQITMVLEGELTFTYDGKEATLKAGDVIAIPSNTVHSAYTGSLCGKAVDAWSPPRKDFFNKMVDIRPSTPDDMLFIKKCIERFRLDDEDLDYRQFVVAAESKEIVGFGRIRPHEEVYELGCVGVVEDRRNQGIGKMIIEHLINNFPTNEVYITTDLIEYFEKFGFKKIAPGPKELAEKLERVCKSKCREGAVAMVFNRKEYSGPLCQDKKTMCI
ncbi:MAG: GNAT family N-acetyltransferase [Deltaproteobacteria bacterium]|nr:GNAT family N-acetyltransferase [Deltaproteobacteria bacterium]